MKYLSLALLCATASMVCAMEQDEKSHRALTPRHYLLKKYNEFLTSTQAEMEEADDDSSNE